MPVQADERDQGRLAQEPLPRLKSLRNLYRRGTCHHPGYRQCRHPLDFPISRQDIAEMTGTTPHSVSRILSAGETKGLVEGEAN